MNKKCKAGCDHDQLRQSPVAWTALVFVGVQVVEADETGPESRLELRNCACGSTLCRALAT